MAMMMNRPDHTTQPPSSVFPNNSMNTSSGQVSGVELAEKMLAASEDIGRRAINIANVGDVRAYLAMEVEVGGIVSVESSLEDKKKAGEKETEGASSTSVDEGEEREGGERPRLFTLEFSVASLFASLLAPTLRIALIRQLTCRFRFLRRHERFLHLNPDELQDQHRPAPFEGGRLPIQIRSATDERRPWCFPTRRRHSEHIRFRRRTP